MVDILFADFYHQILSSYTGGPIKDEDVSSYVGDVFEYMRDEYIKKLDRSVTSQIKT